MATFRQWMFSQTLFLNNCFPFQVSELCVIPPTFSSILWEHPSLLKILFFTWNSDSFSDTFLGSRDSFCPLLRPGISCQSMCLLLGSINNDKTRKPSSMIQDSWCRSAEWGWSYPLWEATHTLDRFSAFVFSTCPTLTDFSQTIP